MGKKCPAALNPRAYPKYLQWAVDQDYSDLLTPAEVEWLAHFNQAFYSADFRNVPTGQWPLEHRRPVNDFRNSERSDALGLGRLGEREWIDPIHPAEEPGEHSPAAERDWNETPAYLNSPEYRAARDAFRTQLASGRAPKPPDPSLKLTLAQARLAKATPPNKSKANDHEQD